MVWVRARTKREAHVDHQPHTRLAQMVIIRHGRRGADEQVVGDLREVHEGIVSQQL